MMDLVYRLAEMAGKGSDNDWVERWGDEIAEALSACPDPEAAVQHFRRTEEFRPSVAKVWAYAASFDSSTPSEGHSGQACDDCRRTGFREIRGCRRHDDGELRERVILAACTCPRGLAIGMGPGVVGLMQVLSSLRNQSLVERESGEPGLIAWQVWTHEAGEWMLDTYADPEAEWRLREGAARRLVLLDRGAPVAQVLR